MPSPSAPANSARSTIHGRNHRGKRGNRSGMAPWDRSLGVLSLSLHTVRTPSVRGTSGGYISLGDGIHGSRLLPLRALRGKARKGRSPFRSFKRASGLQLYRGAKRYIQPRRAAPLQQIARPGRFRSGTARANLKSHASTSFFCEILRKLVDSPAGFAQLLSSPESMVCGSVERRCRNSMEAGSSSFNVFPPSGREAGKSRTNPENRRGGRSGKAGKAIRGGMQTPT